MSLTTYNSWGLAGITNEIHDSQIVPNADGSYTVTFDHTGNAPNTVPFANAFQNTTASIAYRVYVPNAPVKLPSITFTTSTGSNTVQPCATYSQPTSSGLFNNPDNTYAQLNGVPYPSGNTVTVVSGKAPAVPTDVRYWSLCSYAWTSQVVDCRYDGNTKLTNGYYHIVVGTPAQKTAITNAGYSYMLWSTMIMLRNLLGNQTTGEYAPVMKTCSLTDAACIGS
jgi:hypothetical protein